MARRKTKSIMVGNIGIGSDYPISIQSMLNTNNGDVDAAIKQTIALKEAGCDIVRLAVTDEKSLEVIRELKKSVDIPLVADIQFDYKMAIASIENGIDKVRLNPGNIGNERRVKEVIAAAKERNIPIRIGVNTGSVSLDIAKEYGRYSAEGLVYEATRHIEILERNNFDDIAISLKASDVNTMIKAYRLMADKCNYPLHLGVTEAGTAYSGTVKSAIGIGSLLSDGIGDTIRVSLTDNPAEEIRAAKEILKSLDLYDGGPRMISCPTCSRCSINLIEIAKEVEKRLETLNKNVTVAVMGCVVNGPGEASNVDIGITGANGEGLIFKDGKVIKKVKEKDIIDELFYEIEKMF
jgi:(E)-4-hydroxy-3-methylbut-2-enyl-diphosphate synthase